MSNLTIIIVCVGILFAGWLLLRFQDDAWPFSKKEEQKQKVAKNTGHTKKIFGSASSFYEMVCATFPKHIVRPKLGDEDCVFVCEPAIGKSEIKEITILKVKQVDAKQVKTMGAIISITYPSKPSKRELKKDLAGFL